MHIRAGALALAAVMALSGQSDEPILFRTSVSLVNVDAKVSGRDGRDIGDLGASDFIVYDEDERREAAAFAKESTPIEVMLVLDVSPSMRPSLAEMSRRASEALGRLRSGDRAALMLFAQKSEVVQPLTENWKTIPAAITNSIYKDWLGRSTLVNEALVDAARYLKSQNPMGRRTLILVTDNEGFRQAVGDDEVVRALHSVDAVLNAIIIGQAEPKPRTLGRYQNPASGPPDVFRYASATGGDVVGGEDPARALSRIIQTATTRYTLQYPAPSGDSGKFRKIRVELTPSARQRYPDAVVQARSGYELGR